MTIYTPAELRAEAHEIAQWGPEWQGQAAMLRQAAEDRETIEKYGHVRLAPVQAGDRFDGVSSPRAISPAWPLTSLRWHAQRDVDKCVLCHGSPDPEVGYCGQCKWASALVMVIDRCELSEAARDALAAEREGQGDPR